MRSRPGSPGVAGGPMGEPERQRRAQFGPCGRRYRCFLVSRGTWVRIRIGLAFLLPGVRSGGRGYCPVGCFRSPTVSPMLWGSSIACIWGTDLLGVPNAQLVVASDVLLHCHPASQIA